MRKFILSVMLHAVTMTISAQSVNPSASALLATNPNVDLAKVSKTVGIVFLLVGVLLPCCEYWVFMYANFLSNLIAQR